MTESWYDDFAIVGNYVLFYKNGAMILGEPVVFRGFPIAPGLAFLARLGIYDLG